MSHSRRKPTTGRTNSLGFAKVDCHTCFNLGRPCDRQRPQCGPCIKDEHICAGFTMDLTWKDRSSRGSTLEAHVRGSRPRRGFKFVQGGSRPKRKDFGQSRRHHNSSQTKNMQPARSAFSGTEFLSYEAPAVVLGQNRPSVPLDNVNDLEINESTSPFNTGSLIFSEEFLHQDVPPIENNLGKEFDLQVIHVRQIISPTPSAVLFNDLAHRMDPVLNICNASNARDNNGFRTNCVKSPKNSASYL